MNRSQIAREDRGQVVEIEFIWMRTDLADTLVQQCICASPPRTVEFAVHADKQLASVNDVSLVVVARDADGGIGASDVPDPNQRRPTLSYELARLEGEAVEDRRYFT